MSISCIVEMVSGHLLKNDVISFSQKRFYAYRIRVKLAERPFGPRSCSNDLVHLDLEVAYIFEALKKCWQRFSLCFSVLMSNQSDHEFVNSGSKSSVNNLCTYG